MVQQYLEVGKVVNAHGIMGELRVEPWADSPEFLGQFSTLYVGPSHWPIKVLGARTHKKMAILRLEGITDINGVLAMKNQVLYIDRADANLPQGSYFLADLIGLEVRDDATGAVLGSIADVMSLPANNVYVVRGGEREILIPAVDEFIREINQDEGYVRVHLIEGL